MSHLMHVVKLLELEPLKIPLHVEAFILPVTLITLAL
jgi:hypothetical protein